MIKRFFSFVVALSLIGAPAFGQQKPLVIINGQTQQLPAGTTLGVRAATTGAASLNMPQGTAPTSPNNGDCWTTSAGYFCRINGATINLTEANLGSPNGTLALTNGGTGASSATSATTNLQYLQGATGSTARSLTNKLQEYPSVLDFSGVDRTGVSDSAAGIQAAITAVCSAGGGTLLIPRGLYKIGSLLTASCSNFYIKGEGVGATVLSSSSATSGILSFTGAAAQGADGITFASSVTQTGGSAVSITAANHFSLTNFAIDGAYTGINVTGGVIQYFTNGKIVNTVNTAIYINGGNDQFLKNIVADNPALSQPAVAGIRINKTDAVWIDSVDMIHQNVGLLVDPQAASDYITWLFVSNSAFDLGTGTGVLLAPGNAAATIRGANFVNSWTSSNAGNGFAVSGVGSIDGVRVVAHRSFNNQLSGYVVANSGTVANVAFNDSDASGNSTASPGTYSGFDIAANVSGFSITNSRSGQMAGFGNTQSRGIIVNPGSSTNYILSGNDVRLNTSEAIYDGGSGTSKIIKGNLGFNPIANTAITVTASPFTWTNNTGDTVTAFVTGGTVSGITLAGKTVGASTNGSFAVPQGSSLVVTYSAAPTMSYSGF